MEVMTMAYTTINFKTKKALKEAVVNHVAEMTSAKSVANDGSYSEGITAYNPGLGPDLSNFTGKVSLEGPHYPAPHTWYAQAEMKDGKVVKVK